MVDDRHMLRAIELAGEWPHTHPNPRVGAVVVSSTGEVVGEGWHRGPGTDHAEVVALDDAGSAAARSTVYVTLEPCTHHARTPPCTDAIIAADVATVVVGAVDPDDRVSGRGIEKLEDADIEVISDVRGDEARRVDPAYFHHRRTGMPLVTIKWAMTLDGSVAAADGTSQWITGETARADAHGLRSRVDAVVVGAGTLRSDNPGLDVRVDGYFGPQPRPVVIVGRSALPESARIWERDPLVVTSEERDLPAGELVTVSSSNGQPEPAAVCSALADRGLLHLLLEGGPTLAAAWWHAGVVSDGVVYIGPKVGGGVGKTPMAGVFATITEADDVEFATVRSVGTDVLIEFGKKG